MKFINYLKEYKMQSTMIGFSVDETKIQHVVDYIESWLIRYKVPYGNIDTKHISIAQITDRVRKDELVRKINDISTSYVFNSKKITMLYGRDWDFLALEMKKSKEYQELHEKIKEDYNVVEFQGGMKPHISLIKIQKGIASDEFIADVLRDAPVPKRVKAKKVDLWGPNFQVEFSKKK